MKKKFIIGLLCLLVLCLKPQVCFAGSMNGNEQTVYSIATGTFSYNGETYKAKSVYVAQLRAYLNRDDIDLTSAQASKAISMIYSNVEKGVKEGYLTKVSGGSSQTETTKAVETTKTVETTKSQETKKTETSSGVLESEESKGAESATDESKVENSQEIETSVLAIESKQSKKKSKLRGQISYDHEENKIYYEYVDSSDNSTVVKFDLRGNTFVLEITIILTCLAILTLILIAILAIKKCFIFQKDKTRKGRKERQTWRRAIRFLLTIILTIATILLVLITVIQMVFTNKDYLQKTLNANQYYQEIYQDMMQEIHMQLVISGNEDLLLDEDLTLEDFSFVSRNVLKFREANKEVGDCYQEIEKIINTKITDKSLQKNILSIYKTYADLGIGTLIYTFGKIIKRLMISMLIGGIIVLVSIFVLLVMGRVPYTGIYAISRSTLASASILLLGVFFLKTNGIYSINQAFSSYLKPFSNNYLITLYHYLIIVALILLVISVLSFAIGRKIKQDIEEE